MTANWRTRWEKATHELRTVRAENRRLRVALDEVNTEFESILSVPVEGVEAAKTWLIRQQRETIRALKRGAA